jgi:hypothetical protein
MARRRSAAFYEEKAKIAREREAYKLANPSQRTQTYVPKDADFVDAYYRDPLQLGRYLQIPVLKSNLDGVNTNEATALTKLGLLSQAEFDALAGTPVAVEVSLKGNKIPIVKLELIFGDANPVVVPKTQGHGRYVKFYDEKNGKSHRSVPFIGIPKETAFTAGNINLAAIITAFDALMSNTVEKEALVGDNGTAKLVFGFGNQYTVLATKRR